MENFTKILSKTDVQKRLSVPTEYLSSLPSFNGDRAVELQAMDEGGCVWAFKCSTRRKRHPKPVLTRGWLAFVACKNLEAGDKVAFYKLKNKCRTATHVCEAAVPFIAFALLFKDPSAGYAFPFGHGCKSLVYI
ncbi:hypothetical protein POTOM_041671 [Populus tomentosa]|uniref:TF-B3 domain-containing protein n=1 Tax=Populus tomentosa TaxID=118781 RepID=A0A8X7YM93_POPTO|nr:hypothetical protein POTOM_041671 [Populus tomentosa]